MSEPRINVPNLPSPEGERLGKELARLTEAKAREFYQRFPNALRQCGSCAFKAGTIPNRCVITVGDALKCVMEQQPFYCHEHMKKDGDPRLCAGWAIAISTDNPEQPSVACPWEYSQPAET